MLLISVSWPTKVAPKLILVLIFHLCFPAGHAHLEVATSLEVICSCLGIFHGHFEISFAKLRWLTGLRIEWQLSLVFFWNPFSLHCLLPEKSPKVYSNATVSQNPWINPSENFVKLRWRLKWHIPHRGWMPLVWVPADQAMVLPWTVPSTDGPH